MKQEKKVRYYIGKKQYVPEESDMLCSVQHDSFGNETAQKLYRTGKGSFFLVSMNGNSKAMESCIYLISARIAVRQ